MSIIAVLLLCLLSMFAMAELLRTLKVPRVVSHILTGILFGIPFIQQGVFSPLDLSVISFLAEMGLITLLFFVGLQINLRHAWSDLLPAASISFWNTLLPVGLGFFLSKYVFGLDTSQSLLIGVCMGVSAAAIALDLLDELHKLKTRIARTIVAASALDDIVELVLISVLVVLIQATESDTTLRELIAGLSLFAFVALLFRVWIIPWILALVEAEPERSMIFTGSLIITLLMTVLAELLGAGTLVGALVSGIIVREVLLKDSGHKPWERAEITHTIHTIAFGFLVPFFFFQVGLQTQLSALIADFPFAITITVAAIFATLCGSVIGYYLVRKNLREGVIVGWAMNAKGDTELVIAQVALTSGIFSQTMYSSLIFMAVVSTLLAPYFLRNSLAHYRGR